MDRRSSEAGAHGSELRGARCRLGRIRPLAASANPLRGGPTGRCPRRPHGQFRPQLKRAVSQRESSGPRPSSRTALKEVAHALPLLGIRRRSQIDKGELPTRSAVGIPWEVATDMQDMTARSGHYTALLETIGARGATKLHADEREQLLAVCRRAAIWRPRQRAAARPGAGPDRAPAGERTLAGAELR